MREDEEATIRTLKTYRTAMRNLIQRYRGRVVDSPGDNIMAEFASVVDAVNCAVEIQRDLAERNAELPPERRMKFRIGVNLGDIVEDGERIYGDGVNIAARMEGLAEGGGICISGIVCEQVKHKLGLEYEFLGEQEVKNITEPVRAYRVLSFPGAAAHRVVKAKRAVSKTWRNVVVAIAAVLVVGAAVAVWYFYFRPSRPPVEVASVEKMAFPLPDKPSIAVLPFVNMSEDPKQEYFTDGITEDLITDLSQISGLFVIGRNSTFSYKGKPIKIRQVAEELGVRYVLEGSVRKADNQVRINAQLIDATTGGHLWAKRYDGHLDDVFALQDKVSQKIVAALAVELTTGEQKRLVHKETDNIEAYDTFLKGWEHYRRLTPDDFAKAVSYFKKAVELDPNYGRAYAALALTYWQASQIRWYWSLIVNFAGARLQATQYLQMAMKNPTSIAYWVATDMSLDRRQWAEAIAKAERAISLEPNDPSGHFAMAKALIFDGRPEKAVGFVKRAMRLDPHNPARHLYLLGLAHFAMGQLEQAVNSTERALKLSPEAYSWALLLAATYGCLGRDQEARGALQKWSRFLGGFLLDLRYTMTFLPFKDQVVAGRFADGLLKVGVLGRPSGYYKVSEEGKLTGEEIRALVIGRRVAGSAVVGGAQTGYPFQIVSESARYWIEGDLLCTQWQTSTQTLDYCAPVFRNREGTPEGLDEYLIITHYSFVTFSPVD
jgi:TolB-like protein/Flp pilus assembly protein TadD